MHNSCMADPPTSRGGAAPLRMGQAGQRVTTDLYGPPNTKKFNVGGRDRIPDHVLAQDISTRQPTIGVETKNKSYQYLSSQLKDDISMVGPEGKVIFEIPSNATVSKPVRNNPQIEVRKNLPPK